MGAFQFMERVGGRVERGREDINSKTAMLGQFSL